MNMRAEKRPAASPLLSARRIVLKIGSALLVDEATGKVKRVWLDALADDIAAARKRGQDVLIVSSGAIAVGRLHLGLAGGQGWRTLRLEAP